jgi:hypothetical protein
VTLQREVERPDHDFSRIGPLAMIRYAADLADSIRVGSRRQSRRSAVLLIALGIWIVSPFAIMALIVVGAIS